MASRVPNRQGASSPPACRRDLGDREEAARGALPPHLQQPGFRRRHGAHLRRRDSDPPGRVLPAVEPPRRRERIHATEAGIDRLAVAPRVLEHVAEDMAGLGRRGEDLQVIAVVEDRAGPPQVAVEPARDAHRPALDPARQLRAVAGLADQVDVVALDRELADPELAPPTAENKRAPEHLAQLEPAEPGDVVANPLGDVDREARLERRTLTVTQPRASGARY